VLLSWSGGSAAQDRPSSASSLAANPVPPDVVRLKDGGMVRGTIIELVPNGSVRIQLPDGQTRTFAVADTTYAGSDSAEGHGARSSAAPAIAPYATIHAQNAKLALEGAQPNLTFHLETSSAQIAAPGAGPTAVGFTRLCTAPCSVEGRRGLSVSRYRAPTGASFVPTKTSS
jgi:hypothetical protein